VQDEKVLVAGCTGQVGFAVAQALAADNEVWGIARFHNAKARKRLEDAGVQCQAVDLVEPDLSGLPDDFGYVLNFSVARTGSWTNDLDMNAGSVGFLMEHCRSARAMLHCSTTGVYQPQLNHLFTEDDPLGDNHRVWESVLPFLSTYSIAKIASEAAARYGSRRWNLPTVIGRLCVPYGDNGGWPAIHLDFMAAGNPITVHPDRPNRFNPIHEDDIVATIPGLLAAASVPPVVVNWGGSPSSIEEWCGVLGDLTGIEPHFLETDQTIAGVPIDTTTLTALVGSPPQVDLKEGLRRMVAARRPDLSA
jgi:nucleoside-diphosphate-sugar epimerase